MRKVARLRQPIAPVRHARHAPVLQNGPTKRCDAGALNLVKIRYNAQTVPLMQARDNMNDRRARIIGHEQAGRTASEYDWKLITADKNKIRTTDKAASAAMSFLIPFCNTLTWTPAMLPHCRHPALPD
jgi:hypothetical protein